MILLFCPFRDVSVWDIFVLLGTHLKVLGKECLDYGNRQNKKN